MKSIHWWQVFVVVGVAALLGGVIMVIHLDLADQERREWEHKHVLHEGQCFEVKNCRTWETYSTCDTSEGRIKFMGSFVIAPGKCPRNPPPVVIAPLGARLEPQPSEKPICQTMP